MGKEAHCLGAHRDALMTVKKVVAANREGWAPEPQPRIAGNKMGYGTSRDSLALQGAIQLKFFPDTLAAGGRGFMIASAAEVLACNLRKTLLSD